MKILGIAAYYHDSSACLIEDGHIIAATAEERFNRIQHDNAFPQNAIEYCLKEGRCAINEIDYIAFYEKPILKLDRLLHQHINHFPQSWPVFKDTFPTWFTKLNLKKTLRDQLHYVGPIVYIPHHLSHAAGCFLLSGFNEAVTLTIDGVGEWATTTMGHASSKQIAIDKEIRFPDSLGLLYSTMTAYLGFSVNDSEYKVMGLASYGNSARYAKEFKQLITLYKDGSYRLSSKYFAYEYSYSMPSKHMETLFGFPIRKPESDIKSHHEDLAATLQATLEAAVFNLAHAAHKKYRLDSLCLSGGVALNSVVNGKLTTHTPFKQIYIPPDPGDGGGSLGAALYASWRLDKKLPSSPFTPYLGPRFESYEILKHLKKKRLKFTLIPNDQQLTDIVSDYLINQKVIGWFQGRMEWGPRALGNRSILASATKSEMKDIINAKVKKREMFRPFAPVILHEHINDYFTLKNQPESLGAYMLTVLPFTKKGIKEVPATVHVNHTGRPQYIKREANPLYYDLIQAYHQKTGIPAIINTSFNVRGEPIVCTPEDAINCFLHTEIDYLVIDNYIVSKEE
jgi:carbamoyltransferase